MFEYDGLKAALRTAQLIKGGVGEVLDVNPDLVLVMKGSAAHFRAEEILNNLKKGEMPNTANRDSAINLAYKIHANPYFSTAAYWGMVDTSLIGPQFGFQLKQGMPLSLDPQFIDYDTKEIKYSAQQDFAFGFNDLRNTLLSTGANA